MRRRTIALLSVTAAVALGGGVAVARSSGASFRNSPGASKVIDQIDPSIANGASPIGFAPATETLLPPAPDPVAAVRGLLDALIAGEAGHSYSLLGAADRATVGGEAGWQARLTDLPHYLAYQVTATDGASVTTDVTVEPRLDEVVGYVPARAQITWTTVGEDGGYRVAYADSTTTPVLPADDGARAAAQGWVDDEQACRAGAAYDGNLLGQPSLADSLCRARGRFTAGAPVGLDRFRDPTLVLNAFGADAPTFVRVVPVAGPVPFQLALAPLADAWEVIGVIQA